MKVDRYSFTVFVFVTIAVSSCKFGNSQSHVSESTSSGLSQAPIAANDIDLVISDLNAARQRAGALPVKQDPILMWRAQKNCELQAQFEVVGHFSGFTSEIAVEASSAAAAVAGWEDSAGHKAILTGTSYDLVGACRKGDYWTATFGVASNLNGQTVEGQRYEPSIMMSTASGHIKLLIDKTGIIRIRSKVRLARSISMTTWIGGKTMNVAKNTDVELLKINSATDSSPETISIGYGRDDYRADVTENDLIVVPMP